ncbi:MAG: hypothetical protein ACRDPG_09515, partial [Nocardioidaceae bacterium]
IRVAANPAHRHAAIRALANTAVTSEDLAQLRELARDDVDLRWRVLVRQAARDDVDSAEIEALSSRDPDPDSWVRALAVNSARPDPAAKEETWRAIVDDFRVPMGSLGQLRRAFWQRGQRELLAPYASRYLEALPRLHTLGMLPALALSTAMYPAAGVGEGFPARAERAAKEPGVSPVVASAVVEQTDQLRRMLVARAM